MNTIHIYTDGSSRGNPGPAGWGSIVISPETVRELGGRMDLATNNQMELTAVLQSLLYIEEKKLFNLPITFFIDSAYVQKGITLWMYSWEKNNWQTKENNPVLNKDLWQETLFCVFRLKNKVKITFEKVAGHADVFGNEQADRVATLFADAIPTPLFYGKRSDYEKFVSSKPTSPKKASSKSSSKKAYAYIACVNGKIYRDTQWAVCEKRVKGKKGARYKKVFSEDEAIQVTNEFSQYI